MTHSELGRQLKRVHPQYKNVDDGELGRALIHKFPGFYPDQPDDLDSGTMPETPRTLAIQIEQLQHGLRRVVFIARGSKTRITPPRGLKRLTLPSGEFIYDPRAIKPQEIMQAVQEHRLNEILGSVEHGYGAPPKESLQGEPVAVVARDPEGETAHSALTDEAHIPQAAQVAEELKPAGGSVSVEPPQVEVEHRMKHPAGKRWPKPGAK